MTDEYHPSNSPPRLFLLIITYSAWLVQAQQTTQDESIISKQYHQCSANLSVGDCAGIGLGATAAIGIPIFLIWYVRRRRKTKNDTVEAGQQQIQKDAYAAGEQAAKFAHATRQNQLVAQMLAGGMSDPPAK